MPTKKKHAKHMTTDEAVKHLFHPKVVTHAKQTVGEHDRKKGPKDDKRNQKLDRP